MSEAFRAQTLIAPAIAVILAVAWYVGTKTATVQALKQNEADTVDVASKMLASRVALLHERLGAECRMITFDTGLRMSIQHQSASGIKEVLVNVQQRLAVDLVAAFRPDGKLVAVEGDDDLAGGVFTGDALLERALKADAFSTAYWGSSKRLLAMAACPVRYEKEGENLLVIAVGLAIGEPMLASIRDDTHARAIIMISDVEVASVAGDLAPMLDQVRGVAPGADALLPFGGRVVLARAELVPDTDLPVRIYWLRPLERAKVDLGVVGYLLWIPALAAAAIGISRAAREARA